MPLYDFRCTVCGHVFEREKPMSECNWATACPKCDMPAQNTGVYRTWNKTDIKGPCTAHIRDRHSPAAILREDYDPPVESRKDMEDMIKRKGVVPLG